MNEELDVQLVDEGCADEECTDCGQVHDVPSLEGTLKKQRWMYRAVTAGYFISLVAFAGCVYKLVGIWGAAAVASAFSTYFCHLNMRGLIRVLMTLEQVTHNVNEALAAQESMPVQEKEKAPEGGGNYV